MMSEKERLVQEIRGLRVGGKMARTKQMNEIFKKLRQLDDPFGDMSPWDDEQEVLRPREPRLFHHGHCPEGYPSIHAWCYDGWICH
jgi:hypothetical protein